MDQFLKQYSKFPKTEDVRFESEKQRFTFGKYINKTFKEVFEIDKQYVSWVCSTNPEQRKFFVKPYAYFKNRIEEEAKKNIM